MTQTVPIAKRLRRLIYRAVAAAAQDNRADLTRAAYMDMLDDWDGCYPTAAAMTAALLDTSLEEVVRLLALRGITAPG